MIGISMSALYHMRYRLKGLDVIKVPIATFSTAYNCDSYGMALRIDGFDSASFTDLDTPHPYSSVFNPFVSRPKCRRRGLFLLVSSKQYCVQGTELAGGALGR